MVPKSVTSHLNCDCQIRKLFNFIKHKDIMSVFSVAHFQQGYKNKEYAGVKRKQIKEIKIQILQLMMILKGKILYILILVHLAFENRGCQQGRCTLHKH